jgi:NAD(P)-dependent dehydrogenase (short-subunit alcohol dehydrogenase family)
MKVFVTGSTRSFGFELAKAFAAKNHDIILNGRKRLSFKTDFAYSLCASQELTVAEFEKFQPDIIINNAFDKSDCFASLEGQINTLAEAIKYFDPYKCGIIVNINSSMGLMACTEMPEYAMAKWGLRGYSESVRFACYQKGIHIIDIYPGAINIGMAGHRADKNTLIDAQELSEFIVTLCDSKTFIVSSIHINRTK